MRVVALVVALVTLAHAGVWALTRDHGAAPNVEGPFQSLSFAPYGPNDKPDKGDLATAERIRTDLTAIAPHTRAIRTYAATGGLELVPGIAREFGLKTTVGAWIDMDLARNEREIRNAVQLARQNPNVNGIVVGNETIFRDEVTVAELVRYIERVKAQTNVPVTTGEIWHVWIKHPELANAVDFIAAHILPYWEGFSETQAVDQAVIIYDKLRRTFPGKRIVIAEFGWPSAGYNIKAANPGRIEQAQVIREFMYRANKLGMEYNIVEATDQPWKIFEGSVGPYWGMFDADRLPKFALSGPLTDSMEKPVAIAAVLIGLLLCVPIFTAGVAGVAQAATLAVAAHSVGAWFAHIGGYAAGHYFVWGAAFALTLGLILLVPLVLIALSRIDEIAQVAFGRKPQRLLPETGMAAAHYEPKVSIHIPAYKEQPDMLKATLDAIARLDYSNYECVVVINNTPDPAYWGPIEEHCAKLGARFKFLNETKVEGFKAGALRIALDHTAPDAEIIGILDADYVVDRAWLKDLVPAFADARVGLVQAPQEHTDPGHSLMHRVMNGEYAGFFDIGMVQRNEANAIIVHGTMCLIRRAALQDAGNWSSDTIVEDSDLGLTLLEKGWQAHYTRRRYGHGVLPDTYEAFRKQRHRWAYGGMQIIKKHWRNFLPGSASLTSAQKREYVTGWINWLGAETLGVAVAILNLIWVPIVAFAGIAIPDTILTIPILAAFVVSLAHFVALYKLRVKIPARQMAGASVAAMSVQFTVAKAVTDGLIKDHLPFARTAKGGGAKRGREFPAFWETIIGVSLWIGAALLVLTNRNEIREIYVFAVVLVVQSLPFLAATAIAALEGSKVNETAYWAGLATRARALVTRGGTTEPETPAIAEANREAA
jgi:exo-beta-1,3-glucanase (GH17 family)/cellulose synthase/poly-beta-1,6-N-acetylglucosamine synthase-like glycosyltransferase